MTEHRQPFIVAGIGIDLCEIHRMETMLERLGVRFLSRAFTPNEIDAIGTGRDAGRRCAAIFAAKEAIVKCLGTGFSDGVGWRQVEVTPDGSWGGGWQVTLKDRAMEKARDHGRTAWSVDIHLGQTHAAAVALLTVANDPGTKPSRGTLQHE